MDRKQQLEHMVDLIETSSKGSETLEEAISFAKEKGIVSNMHVGNSQEWFNEDRDQRVPEWLMGQFIDGFEKDMYLAFNSGINLSRSFLAGTY